MLTDLVQIKRQGEQKRGENERFRRHLKTHNFVERKLRHIAEEVEGQINCLDCGNCCRVATAKLAQRDVEKLVKFLRLPLATFLREYTELSEDEGRILKRDEETGCVFLSGNECTVYEARPGSCQDFPHVVRGAGSLQSRVWAFIDRACYCPIVYNTMEAWKVNEEFSPTPK